MVCGKLTNTMGLTNRLKLSSLPILLLFAVIVYGIFNFFFAPFGYEVSESASQTKGAMDFLFLGLAAVHGIFLLTVPAGRGALSKRLDRLYRIPEFLFSITLVFFLFSFIFALNANMDYVQRFAASSGNIRLAPDSSIQRSNSLIRFLPFLAVDAMAVLFYRIRYPVLTRKMLQTGHPAGRWGLGLSLSSSLLYTVSLPSFVSTDGLAPAAFFCLVPLILAVRFSTYRRAVFYGVVFGVVQTMLCNYWLGTFSLVSLQFITVYYFILYTIFMAFALWIVKRNWEVMFFTLPAVWVIFDFLRTTGFMGYPWSMLGTSQYQFLPFIQIASLTGVWGVSFTVILINGVLSELVTGGIRIGKSADGALSRPTYATALITGIVLFASVMVFGEISLMIQSWREPSRTVSIALIQQNTDPRKNDYRASFERLTAITDRALQAEQADLVAWSETAFVPNIRKWSKVDPRTSSYARLVLDFLEYQKSIGTWLLTGNDDYMTVATDEGELRQDYNASILFSPEGERVQTYHKLHLVPFTEYFPYKEQFPGFYNMLLDFDINLWEPGDEIVVFDHPLFTFATPICFEDSFPADIRRFVREGAEVVLNLSNDFWSLTDVEAQQHFSNALFRAVENRRPLVRATASGITASVDTSGKIRSTLPTYVEGYLVADVEVPQSRSTLYLRWGDWFPIALMVLLLVTPLTYYFFDRSGKLGK